MVRHSIALSTVGPSIVGLYLVLFSFDLLPRSLSDGNGPSDLDTGFLVPGLVLTLFFGSVFVVTAADAVSSWRRRHPADGP